MPATSSHPGPRQTYTLASLKSNSLISTSWFLPVPCLVAFIALGLCLMSGISCCLIISSQMPKSSSRSIGRESRRIGDVWPRSWVWFRKNLLSCGIFLHVNSQCTVRKLVEIRKNHSRKKPLIYQKDLKGTETYPSVRYLKLPANAPDLAVDLNTMANRRAVIKCHSQIVVGRHLGRSRYAAQPL